MWKKCGLVIAVLVLVSLAVTAQPGPDPDASWNAFIDWLKAAPPASNPLEGYAAKLRQDGLSDADVSHRMAWLLTRLGQRSDWIGIYYDKIYRRPLTGNPANDGFSTDPSPLLVESIKGLKPGAALDAGMGQGRNAVFLAQQGWEVTGFDVSAEAVAATAANATKAGVRVEAVRASYDEFDFGAHRWDLIVMTFAWAPVTDPAFVARVRRSLRPGGRVVFEHFVHAGSHPASGVIKALKPGQLRQCFAGFEIPLYQETEDTGDWGGPNSSLVRMVAVASSDISGTWSGQTTLSRGTDVFTLVLEPHEGSYSGTISDELGLATRAPLVDIRYANGDLSFAFTASLPSRDLRIEVTLKLEIGRLVGWWTAESGDTGPFDFERKG